MICVCCRENNPIFYLMMTLVERRNVVVFTFFFNMRNILAQYFLCKCLSRSLLIRKKIFETGQTGTVTLLLSIPLVVRTYAPCKGISGFRNAGNFCCWNPDPRPWNLEYNSGNPESHLQLECGIQVPLTKNPQSRTRNPQSMAWTPDAKTVLHFLT